MKDLCWRGPAEDLARAVIESVLDGREHLGAMCAKVGALRKVLAQQALDVFVGAAHPRTAWVGKEDPVAEQLGQFVVARHFRTLVPGQGESELCRDRVQDPGETVAQL